MTKWAVSDEKNIVLGLIFGMALKALKGSTGDLQQGVDSVSCYSEAIDEIFITKDDIKGDRNVLNAWGVTQTPGSLSRCHHGNLTCDTAYTGVPYHIFHTYRTFLMYIVTYIFNEK